MQSKKSEPSKELIARYLNNFAIRSFRDVADGDYITARAAFKAKQFQQFLVLGHQAVEKYLKCILLLNRIKAKGIQHDILKAKRRIRNRARFEFKLTIGTEEFIEYLNDCGEYRRYYEVPYYVSTVSLPQLDKAVWEIRRYCLVLDRNLGVRRAGKLDAEWQLERVKKSEKEPYISFKIFGGYLEEVLQDKDHPGRRILVWHNHCFGSKKRTKLEMPGRFQAGNPPITLMPEMLDYVAEYVYLPGPVTRGYRERKYLNDAD